MMEETKTEEKVAVEFIRKRPPYMVGDVAGFQPAYSQGLIDKGYAKPHKPKLKLPGLKRQMDAGDKGSGYVTKG